MGNHTGVQHNGWHAGAALLIGMIAALALLEVALRLVPILAVEVHGRGPVTLDDHRRFFAYDPDLGWHYRPVAPALSDSVRRTECLDSSAGEHSGAS